MFAVARHRFARLAAPRAVRATTLLACALLIAAAPAAARPRPVASPHIAFVRCSAVPYPCTAHTTLTRTGHVLVGVKNLKRSSRVIFPVRSTSGRRGARGVSGVLRTKTRIVVRVPGNAVSGVIRVVNPGRHRSNGVRVTVRRQPPPRHRGPWPTGQPSVFDGNGMWIWYLSKSEGGDVAKIAAQAKAHGVSTVFVKSADGIDPWAQFSAANVAALKAAGLHVCGWQFVYGKDPIDEASAGAVAALNGADCFVIDAESAYEGKYKQAQQYMTELRAQVGPTYPIGLTSFPYVDFHPSLPYSVFLAPGNATFNLPQVYWKTIGDSVDASLAHTYEWNSPYQAPIYPLGQTYDGAPAKDIVRFRELSAAYGARGLSWWDWQETTSAGWNAVGAPLEQLPLPTTPLGPTLKAGAGGKVGSRGDLVLWAQEHLAGAGQLVTLDGAFGESTTLAVQSFQASVGLPQTGVIDEATWPALLRTLPVVPDWTAPKPSGGAATASAASTHYVVPAGGPRSASLPATRDEVPPQPQP
jgi:hypothetical protein